MKPIIPILAVLSFSCTKPIEKSHLNGVWEVFKVCEDSMLPLHGYFTIHNDTLYSFEPPKISKSKTWLNITNDSLTLYDDCFLDRGKYELRDEQLFIGDNNKYIWKRLNPDSVKPKMYFTDKGMSIELMQSYSKQFDNPKPNSRMLLVGYKDYAKTINRCPNSNTDFDIDLDPLEFEEEPIEQPFDLPSGVEITHYGVTVKPSELKHFGQALKADEDLLLFIDKSIPDSLKELIIKELDINHNDIYFGYLSSESDIRYKKL